MDTPNNQPNDKHSLYLKARSSGGRYANKVMKDAYLAKLVNDIPVKLNVVNDVSEVNKKDNTLELIFPDPVKRKEFIDRWERIFGSHLKKVNHLLKDEPTLQDDDYKELIDKWNKSRRDAEQQGAIYHLAVDALRDSKPIVFVNGITGIEVRDPNYDMPDFKATVEQMSEQWDNADRHIKHYHTVEYPDNNTVPHKFNFDEDRVTAMNHAILNNVNVSPSVVEFYATTVTHTVTPHMYPKDYKRKHRNWFYLLMNKLFNIE